MNWFERKIRRYEHRRWTTDDNRRVQPFTGASSTSAARLMTPIPEPSSVNTRRKAIESSRDW